VRGGRCRPFAALGDREVRQRVETARAWGVPLSTLDGRPTEQLHEHFDAEGNFIGSTVVSVPGWTSDDRAWALGLTEYEATRCPRGHNLAESLDKEWKWIPDPPVVCFACVALDNTVKAYENHPEHRAMLHSLHKVPRPKPKKRR
jgi:hypothetical protein